MNSRDLEMQERVRARLGLSSAERAKLVRRARRAYLDPDVRMEDWRARYLSDIRAEAKEGLTLEQLRYRG